MQVALFLEVPTMSAISRASLEQIIYVALFCSAQQQCQSGFKTGGCGSIFKNWGVVGPKSSTGGGL